MPTGDPSSIIGQLALIVFLVLLNAFFASAEMALVSLNKNRISLLAGEGNKKAMLLEKLVADPSNFLATIQVGITLAGFFSSASAATGLAGYFSVYLGNIPFANEISVVVITVILSYITLVFGELFPKRVALQNAEQIAMFAVKPVMFIGKLAKPFVLFLSFSTNILVKITGIGKDSEEKVSREEITSLAQAGQEDGTINVDEYQMIKGVFQLDEKIAREIMTPRTNTFILDVATPKEAIADMLLEGKYSRIPVYQDDPDMIIGLLHIKDFFAAARKVGFNQVDIRKLLREPYFVPETKYIDDLLKDMLTTRNQLSVLIDEYGGFSGIVTIEDLVEEIVGEIDDEYDESEGELTQIDENTFIANGTLPIEEFNEQFHTKIEDSNIDTIAGFVLSRIGSVPVTGEHTAIEHDQYLLTVQKVTDKRLDKIKIEKRFPTEGLALQ